MTVAVSFMVLHSLCLFRFVISNSCGISGLSAHLEQHTMLSGNNETYYAFQKCQNDGKYSTLAIESDSNLIHRDMFEFARKCQNNEWMRRVSLCGKF